MALIFRIWLSDLYKYIKSLAPTYIVTILLSSSNSLILGLVGIYVSRTIGPYDRGHLGQLILITLLASIMSDLGTQSSVTYFIAQNRKLYELIYPWALRRMTIRTLFLGSPIIIASRILGWLTTSESIVIVCYLSLGTLLAVNMHALQAVDIVKWRTYLLIQIPVFLIINLYLTIFGYTVLGVFISIYLSNLSPPMVAFFKVRNDFSSQVSSESNSIQQNFTSYANKAVIWEISMQIFNRVDLIMVLVFFGKAEMGNYSVVISWLLISTPLFGALGNIGFPRLASLREFSENRNTYALKLFFASLIVAFFIVFSFAILGSKLLPILLGEGYRNVGELLPALVLMSVAKLVLPVVGDIARGKNIMVLFSSYLYAGALLIVGSTFLFSAKGLIWSVHIYSLIEITLIIIAGLNVARIRGK